MGLAIEDFAGAWRLDRRIWEGGRVSSFEGRASLERAGDAWLWREEGTLALPDGARVHAERRHLWRPEGGAISVAFEDGRPFYAFDPGGDTCTLEHDCPPDAYLGSLDLTGFPDWLLEWRVSGPRKSYVSRTRHTRALASARDLRHPVTDMRRSAR